MSTFHVPPRLASAAMRYAMALFLVGTTVALQWLVEPFLGNGSAIGILFLAILVAAWCGGFGPAALVSLAGLFSIAALFPDPAAEQEGSIADILFFFLITLGIALLGAGMSRARRRAEIAAEQLRITLSSIGDAVMVTDRQGTVVSLNPVAEELTGWRLADAIGQSMSDVFVIVNEHTRLPAANPATRAIEEGVIVGLANHTLLITRDNHERPIDDSAAPIRSREGKIIGCVLVFRDVTERRRAESALRESEARFAQLADNISQLAWMADEKGSIFWYNRRWYEYTGTSPGEMRDQGWRKVLHPDYADSVIETLHRCFETGATWEDTFPLRAGGSNYRWFLSRATPIRDSAGRIDRWFGTCTDITDQRENEEELRHLAAKLSDADRRKDAFLATLAHELRNPLAPISTGLEVMKLSADDPDQLEEVRSTMERQTQQLVTLVDDLMDVSRITRGKLELRRCRVGLNDVIRSAVEAARPLIEDANHQFTVSLPEHPVFLNADPHRLAQVFSNLLNNAAKYTPEGGQISLSAVIEDANVVVSVKDNGIGIPPENQEQIFEMFGQVEHPIQRSTGGLGIGLALVKSLVEMHGGEIEVHSEGTGRGSAFVVRLASQPATLMENEAPTSPTPVPAAGSRRVLVVDDNQAAANMLSMAVRMLGNEVLAARDGQEAVEIAEEFRPDVVLMDIGMPRMNGYEAARRIRQQPWGANIRLVAITGWGQDEDKQRSKEAGFDYHLIKPAAPADLRRLLAADRVDEAESLI